MTTTVFILNSGHDKNVEVTRTDGGETRPKVFVIEPGRFKTMTIWDGIELKLTEIPMPKLPIENDKIITLQEHHD